MSSESIYQYQPPAYVYKITHRVTGEFYIGYRYQNQANQIEPERDLFVEYFTSSKYVLDIIKRDGKDAFDTKIIFTNQDSIVCWTYEQLIILDNWKHPLLLNKKVHDPSSNVEIYRRVGMHSDETKAKMSKSNRGVAKSESHKNNIGAAHLGKKLKQSTKDLLSIIKTGQVSARDITSGKFVVISKLEFDLNPEKYCGTTSNCTTVFNVEINEFVKISIDEFKEFPQKYIGPNSKILRQKSAFITSYNIAAGYKNMNLDEMKVAFDNLNEFARMPVGRYTKTLEVVSANMVTLLQKFHKHAFLTSSNDIGV